jgi:hypothetical protein
MSDIVQQPNSNLDGFDAYTDVVDGEEEYSSGAIVGTRIKFTNEATWVTHPDNKPLPVDALTIWDIQRVIQKWPVDDGPPIEERFLEPGEKVPSIKALNEAAPKEEWREGPNGLQGPWQFQRLIYFIDPNTMTRYTWANGTTGGAICCKDAVDRTRWMRRWKGVKVYPEVAFSHVFMPTKYGGRQRPHFIFKRWITFGDDGVKAINAPAQQFLEDFGKSPEPAKVAAAPTQTTPTQTSPAAAPVQTVKPPTAKEVTGDEILY